MNENEDLQKLLRLKNYETPGEEYFDNFLDELKERQRQDGLKLSTLDLVKERVSVWYDELGSAKWAVPAGSFAAVLFTVFAFSNKQEQISETHEKGTMGIDPGSSLIELDLQLPERPQIPMAVPSGNSSVLPAGFREF